MLYDPITGIKTLGLEKVQKIVPTLRHGTGYAVEWLVTTIPFADKHGQLVVTRSMYARFFATNPKEPLPNTADTHFHQIMRKCDTAEALGEAERVYNTLTDFHKRNLSKKDIQLFMDNKNRLARGQELITPPPTNTKIKEKEKEEPKYTLDHETHIKTWTSTGKPLLVCYKANICRLVNRKPVPIGVEKHYYWIDDESHAISQLPDDSDLVQCPQVQEAIAAAKAPGGGPTSVITPAVEDIVRIHHTYAN